MSGKLMGQVYSLLLTRSERDVLLALADHADDDGRNARPGVGYMAWKTELSTRQVERCLLALRRKGIIARVGGGGNGKATEYLIDLSQAVRKTPYAPKAPSRSADTIMSDDSHDTAMSDDSRSADIPSEVHPTVQPRSSDISAHSSDIAVSSSTPIPTPVETPTTTVPPTHDAMPSGVVVGENVLNFAQSRAGREKPINRSKFTPDLHHKYMEHHRATIRNPGGFLRSCAMGEQDAAIEFWLVSESARTQQVGTHHERASNPATGRLCESELLRMAEKMRDLLAQGYMLEHLRVKYRGAMTGDEWRRVVELLDSEAQATAGARIAV
jgi:hypothetical protein